jgi:hypothetical protein
LSTPLRPRFRRRRLGIVAAVAAITPLLVVTIAAIFVPLALAC